MNPTRIQSIDYLRGAVMILMAVDHVRVYSGMPPGGPEVDIFLTRWITHFCAPAFAFFAGTSAYLYGEKTTRSELTKFLITRGLLLVVLELTLLRFLWAFNISTDFILAGVIWMLGWCMVLLTLFVPLGARAAAILGVAIIAGQALFTYVPSLLPEAARTGFGKIWEFVYPSGFETFAGVNILYVLAPWIGVMTAGYGFGAILRLDNVKKRKYCLSIGVTSIAIFVIAGSVIALRSENAELPFVLQVLNQRKYPASLLYLLMTLGPIIALVPYADKAKGWFSSALVIIGKVPFFYYVLHILVIHLSALVVNYMLFGFSGSNFYETAPYTWMEDQYRWGLPLLYFVFAVDVIVLYFLCRWYAKYKQAHPGVWWVRYV